MTEHVNAFALHAFTDARQYMPVAEEHRAVPQSHVALELCAVDPFTLSHVWPATLENVKKMRAQ